MIVLQIIVWLDALFFQAPAPHGMGRALCARGGAAPLSPHTPSLPPPCQPHTTYRETHKIGEKEKNTPLSVKFVLKSYDCLVISKLLYTFAPEIITIVSPTHHG